jgi:hypothetical protein
MPDVCDRCGFPVIQVAGQWRHESMADAAFCALVMSTSKPDEGRCSSCGHRPGCECTCCYDGAPVYGYVSDPAETSGPHD